MKSNMWKRLDDLGGRVIILGYVAAIVLKAVGIIRWSWWVVLAPCFLIILLVTAVVAGSFIQESVKKKRARTRNRL